MIKHLVEMAKELDATGLKKEADQVDFLIKKIASNTEKDPNVEPRKHRVREGDTLSSMTERFGAGAAGYTVMDNLAYNKKKDPNFDERKMRPNSYVYIYCDNTCE
jgi:hypothetical protein